MDLGISLIVCTRSSEGGTGIDVSTTAVKKAQLMFPDIRFEVADLLKNDIQRWQNSFDIVIQKEVLWYVLTDVELFLLNMNTISKRYLYLSQSFPDSSDFLGSDLFPNAITLKAFIEERFTILHSTVEQDPEFGDRELIHIFAEKS